VGPPGPFLLRPYLLGTYSDPRNPKAARVPTYCPQFLISVFGGQILIEGQPFGRLNFAFAKRWRWWEIFGIRK
jgi:hypothetical protein